MGQAAGQVYEEEEVEAVEYTTKDYGGNRSSVIPLIIGVVVVSRAWSSAHRKVEAAESPQEIARTQTERSRSSRRRNRTRSRSRRAQLRTLNKPDHDG